MKLAPRTYAIQWDVHAWTGVAASLVLFILFYCGVFALYRNELAVWQDPVLHAPPPHASPPSFAQMHRGLVEHTKASPHARLGFAIRPDRRFASAWMSEGRDVEMYWIDSVTGRVAATRSRLADELYDLHFLHQLPGGQVASGLLSVALLVALATGLAIHLKDLRRQWWQFRPALRLRVSSSDAHKVLGVFGLPFTAALAWSGAVLCLGSWVAVGFTMTNFGGDFGRLAALHDSAWPSAPPPAADGAPRSLDEIIAAARTAVGAPAQLPSRVDVYDQGEPAAFTRVSFDAGAVGARRFAFVGNGSGAVLGTSDAPTPPSGRFTNALVDLHFGNFGGWLAKLLYALLAIGVCVVIATGNVVWLERRDPVRARAGNRLLLRLTVGVAGGLVLASSAYFLANRALPVDLAARADRELQIFLLVWAVAAVAALVPPWSARRITCWLAAVSSSVFAAVVLWGVVALDANLVTALGRGVPDVFVVEVLVASLAIGCGAIARGMRTRRVPAAEGITP